MDASYAAAVLLVSSPVIVLFVVIFHTNLLVEHKPRKGGY